ncbi:MAG: phenylpyruvate tautomerase MIF-related protein [Planctomycetota bacterium]
MPLIKVHTSAPARDEARERALLARLSRRLAEHTGKPEAYVMTCLMPRALMTFAGDPAPACYLEVKSIGRMEPARTAAMSADLCAIVAEELGVPGERTYIEFCDAPGHLWGHAGETFA